MRFFMPSLLLLAITLCVYAADEPKEDVWDVKNTNVKAAKERFDREIQRAKVRYDSVVKSARREFESSRSRSESLLMKVLEAETNRVAKTGDLQTANEIDAISKALLAGNALPTSPEELGLPVTSLLPQPHASVRVSGTGFKMSKLKNGALAFSNKTYILGGVPASIKGWSFTHKPANVAMKATGTVLTDGYIFVAAGRKGLGHQPSTTDGWRPMNDLTFVYSISTSNCESLVVYGKKVRKGMRITLPQEGYFGVMFLVPPSK